MRGGRRTTIVDVGRHAGVSTKTVSRVFNGEPHVSEEVRKRVRASAAELNYHPNVMAQALVRRRSHLIGLVYENPSPSYVVDLQKGVLDRLKGERYQLVVVPVSSVTEREREVVGLLRSAALDGVVLAPPISDSVTILEDLRAADIRFARIAPTRSVEMGPCNLLDDVAAAEEIAAHVIAQGHRDIAIIKGDPTHAASEARMAGYARAFERAGVPIRSEWIESGMFTRESGQRSAQRLLSGAIRPTAILAQNDDMAVGALIAARKLGMNVPEDLSIAGFDDSEIAEVAWPGVTTIRQPVYEMARMAADMVVAQLDGAQIPPCQIHQHRMILRQSIAKPRIA